MAIGPVVTRGYGSFGSVNLVVTRGYSASAAPVVETPLQEPYRPRAVAQSETRLRIVSTTDDRLRKPDQAV